MRQYMFYIWYYVFFFSCIAISRVGMVSYGASLICAKPDKPKGSMEFVWLAPNTPFLYSSVYSKPDRNCDHSHDTLVTLPEILHGNVYLVMQNLYHTKVGRTNQVIGRQRPGRAPPSAE
jgi:hypothetical protein